ncbi:MAG: tRNA (adenine(22)-N(1))-methyltransferase [Lachnospiraceae bacterium]
MTPYKQDKSTTTGSLQLSDRLRALADMVPTVECMADVGTDHAYLPLYLLQVGKIHRALALDVHAGPLQIAREHIKAQGQQEAVTTVLSDGLSAVSLDAVDCVVIAGMGGALILRILEEGREKLRDVGTIILQPQSQLALVREFLQQNGFAITEEKMLCEDGKYYTILSLQNAEHAIVKEEFLQYGELLLRHKDKVLYEYLLYKRKQYEQLLEKVQPETHSQRYGELRKELRLLMTALEYYES